MAISMAAQPSLNDMVRTAMQSGLGRAKIAEEARRQLQDLGDEGNSTSQKREDNTKTSSISTEYVNKLAEAGEYICSLLEKGAEVAEAPVGPGKGPGALEVGLTPVDSGPALHTNTHVIGNMPPMHPGLQKARPNDSATQMENDDDHVPGAKSAAPLDLLRKLAEGEVADPFLEEAAVNPNVARATAGDVAWGAGPGALLGGVGGQLLIPRADVGRALGRSVPSNARIMGSNVLGAALAGGLSRVGMTSDTENPASRGALLGGLGGGLASLPLGVPTAVLNGLTGAVHGAISAKMLSNTLKGRAAQMQQQAPNPAVAEDLAAAEDPSKLSAPLYLLRKLAENATNPAHISAGSIASTALPTSRTGEAGPPASGKDRVPATAAGVADLTRREAKSVPKQEMGALLDEPMMSAGQDNVLQQAFTHTGESGAKVASAQVSLNAARALLRNLAQGGR